jgi:hypothetical protein
MSRRAIRDFFAPGPRRGIVTFPGRERTQPVLIEFILPQMSVMGVIYLRDPVDFNFAGLACEITALTRDPHSHLFRILVAPPIVNIGGLEVSWNLGHRSTLAGIPQNAEFEFSRVFAMMSHRGWRDHFVVPLNGGSQHAVGH